MAMPGRSAGALRALGDEVLATAAQYAAIEDRIQAFQDARLRDEVPPERQGYVSELREFERQLLQRHNRALRQFLEAAGR